MDSLLVDTPYFGHSASVSCTFWHAVVDQVDVLLGLSVIQFGHLSNIVKKERITAYVLLDLEFIQDLLSLVFFLEAKRFCMVKLLPLMLLLIVLFVWHYLLFHLRRLLLGLLFLNLVLHIVLSECVILHPLNHN